MAAINGRIGTSGRPILPVFGVAASAPALWTPAVLGSAVVGWWDASDFSTITLNAGNVSTWAGKMGTTSATQATAGNQPIYNANFGGYPSLQNDATRSLSMTSLTGFPVAAAAGMISAVGQTTAVGGGNQGYAVGYGRATAGMARNIQLLQGSITADLDSSGISQAVNPYLQDRITVAGFAGGSTPQTVSLSVDGTTTTASLSPNTGVGSGAIFGRAQFGDRYLIGHIREIVITNRALTTGETDQLTGYYAWKWGLVANLPAGFPYKNAPP